MKTIGGKRYNFKVCNSSKILVLLHIIVLPSFSLIGCTLRPVFQMGRRKDG